VKNLSDKNRIRRLEKAVSQLNDLAGHNYAAAVQWQGIAQRFAVAEMVTSTVAFLGIGFLAACFAAYIVLVEVNK